MTAGAGLAVPAAPGVRSAAAYPRSCGAVAQGRAVNVPRLRWAAGPGNRGNFAPVCVVTPACAGAAGPDNRGNFAPVCVVTPACAGAAGPGNRGNFAPVWGARGRWGRTLGCRASLGLRCCLVRCLAPPVRARFQSTGLYSENGRRASCRIQALRLSPPRALRQFNRNAATSAGSTMNVNSVMAQPGRVVRWEASAMAENAAVAAIMQRCSGFGRSPRRSPSMVCPAVIRAMPAMERQMDSWNSPQPAERELISSTPPAGRKHRGAAAGVRGRPAVPAQRP